jgi:CBS domain-containing protein
MKAVDVMPRNVVSVKLDSSVFEAAQLMILNRLAAYFGQARRCRDRRRSFASRRNWNGETQA